MINNKEKLEKLVQGWQQQKKLSNISLALSRQQDDWSFATGDLRHERPYFIASTTKLFITAIFLQLQAAGRLNIEDKIEAFTAARLLDRLHIWKGKDASREITIKHLLSQSSGLADYFQQRSSNGTSLQDTLMQGQDCQWNPEEAVEMARTIGAQFPPGQGRRALYSDTNYQLLGHILERVLDQDLSQILAERILDPLGMVKTYLYRDEKDAKPLPLQYKKRPLLIPKAMVSFGPDGGIVSTSKELMRFIRAFFEGVLFPKDYLIELQDWKKIFFPLRYGVGLAQFRLPWIFTPFSTSPTWIGHSGLSGAFAFYCPKKELYLTGTVNEIHPPSLSFQLIVKLTNAIQS